MNKGKIYTQKIDNDENFLIKSNINDSTNYLHDKERQDKDRWNGQFYFASSLILTLLASFFHGEFKLVAILLLANILIGGLVRSRLKRNTQRKIFWNNRGKMKKTFDEWGLEWKD